MSDSAEPISEEHKAVQKKAAEFYKQTGKAGMMMVARFVARIVAESTRKLAAGGASLPNGGTEYTLVDHMERLRYLEFTEESLAEQKAIVSELLQGAAQGLQEFVQDDKYGVLLGKMAYNAIGVTPLGGRENRVSNAPVAGRRFLTISVARVVPETRRSGIYALCFGDQQADWRGTLFDLFLRELTRRSEVVLSPEPGVLRCSFSTLAHLIHARHSQRALMNCKSSLSATSRRAKNCQLLMSTSPQLRRTPRRWLTSAVIGEWRLLGDGALLARVSVARRRLRNPLRMLL